MGFLHLFTLKKVVFSDPAEFYIEDKSELKRSLYYTVFCVIYIYYANELIGLKFFAICSHTKKLSSAVLPSSTPKTRVS